MQGYLSEITDNLSQNKTDTVLGLGNLMSSTSFCTQLAVIQPDIYL